MLKLANLFLITGLVGVLSVLGCGDNPPPPSGSGGSGGSGGSFEKATTCGRGRLVWRSVRFHDKLRFPQ